jgi:hypothetical protein
MANLSTQINGSTRILAKAAHAGNKLNTLKHTTRALNAESAYRLGSPHASSDLKSLGNLHLSHLEILTKVCHDINRLICRAILLHGNQDQTRAEEALKQAVKLEGDVCTTYLAGLKRLVVVVEIGEVEGIAGKLGAFGLGTKERNKEFGIEALLEAIGRLVLQAKSRELSSIL